MTFVPALLALETTDVAGLAGAEGPDLTRYLMVCGFLVLLILLLGVGMRKVTAAGWVGRGSARTLETLDVLPLGGRQKLAVVRCYDRSYLIGMGDKEVRLLAALDPEQEESDQAPADTVLEATPAAEEGFLAALRRSAADVLPAPRRRARAGLGKGLLG